MEYLAFVFYQQYGYQLKLEKNARRTIGKSPQDDCRFPHRTASQFTLMVEDTGVSVRYGFLKRQALQIVMPYVRKNKEAHADSAFLESDLFGSRDSKDKSRDFSIADELVKLAQLRDKGDISQDEYELLKARLIDQA